METQANVAAGGGEPVAGKRNTYSDGITEWHSIRNFKDAGTEPTVNDYVLAFPLAEHVEGIGCTGFDGAALRSQWWSFDYDALDHADGLSAEDLEKVKQAASDLPYVEVRRSTGGKGLHLYVRAIEEGIPCPNHTAHAAAARAILAKMSADTGYDLTAKVDVFGAVLWQWHRKLSIENQGLALLKPATQYITEADLPAGWREPKEKPKTTPIVKAARHPVDDDFCRTSKFDFLVELGWTCNGETFRRPGTDKPVSASMIVAENGDRLLHVFTSGAPPLEIDHNYNPLSAYALLKHDGDVEAARAALLKLGYGRLHIPMITGAELHSTSYDRQWHIPGVVVATEPLIAAGSKKTLKTSLIMDMAISIARGTMFLNQFEVTGRCPVAFMSGESGRGTLQDIFRRVCKSKGVQPSQVKDVLFTDFIPRFDDAQHLDGVERMLQETGVGMLIIDPIYLAMSGADAANLFVQGTLLRRVSELCQRHGVTLVLLHHTRKRGKTRNQDDFDPPELDDIAWAGFAEFARQWILIGRREEYTPGTGEHRLWLSIGGSAGHSALWAADIGEGVSGLPRYWKVTLSTPDTARANQKAGSTRQRLLDAAANFPQGETKTVLFAAAKLRTEFSTRAVFDGMVETGELVPCKVRKNGTPLDAYRLATAA
jgi:hypothetical protein